MITKTFLAMENKRKLFAKMGWRSWSAGQVLVEETGGQARLRDLFTEKLIILARLIPIAWALIDSERAKLDFGSSEHLHIWPNH